MRRAAAVACLSLLATASYAQAAQRYATPAGTGAACSTASPCSFDTAVSGAKPNDEVIVGAGVHTVAATALLPGAATGVHIHGDFDAARPTIAGAVSGEPLLRLDAAGSRAGYLELQNTAAGAVGLRCGDGATVERVFARAIGSSSAALRAYGNCTLRDSVATASGLAAVAVTGIGNEPPGGNLAVVRNVTAIASGDKSVGVRSAWGSINEGTSVLSLENSIASGTAVDLEASSFIGVGEIHVSHSNFDSAKPAESGPGSIVDQGGNQAAPALFVDAAAGNYRQAAGSPTIDAGSTDQIGPTDYDGNPRLLGAAPDIGAFELVTPRGPPSTLAAGVLTALRVSPRKFHPAKAAAVRSCFQKYKDAIPGPRCASIEFELSGPGVATLKVERRLPGRRFGGKCRRPTPANAAKPRCARFRALPGSLRLDGSGGADRVTFSGWLAGRKLKAGSYRLLGEGGGAVKSAPFRITG